MWSKTKKILESRLAQSLKGRVEYRFVTYRPKGGHHCTYRFSILVDNEIWFQSDDEAWLYEQKEKIKYMESLKTLKYSDEDIWTMTNERETLKKISNTSFKNTGIRYSDDIAKDIHEYLNVYNAMDCLKQDNYMLHVFAILDEKIGKPTIIRLQEDLHNEPMWYAKWVLLRAKAEGLVREDVG